MSCAVCIESIITGDGSSVARCGHCLHSKCWEQCLKTAASVCPVCRKPTTSQQLVRVYFNGDGDDITESFSRKISSLTAEVRSLIKVNQTTEKKVSSQQSKNTSLRAELKKNDGKLAEANKELQHLRDQFKNKEAKREQLHSYRRRFEDEFNYCLGAPCLARSSGGKSKREKFQKLLELIQEEAEKIRSEVRTVKSGKTTPDNRSMKIIHALETKLNQLKELSTNLNERLQPLSRTDAVD